MSRRTPKIRRADRVDVEIHVAGARGRSRTLKASLGAAGLNNIIAEVVHGITRLRGSIRREKFDDLLTTAQEGGARGVILPKTKGNRLEGI